MGNDKNSYLGKLFLKRNIKKENVNDEIFNFFKDRVNKRIKVQKKDNKNNTVNKNTINGYNYNGDDVS